MNIIDPGWEIAAITGTVILIAKMSSQLTGVPRLVKWTHWGLVGIFSLVGINGFPIALMFCLKHKSFVEAFSQLNILGVNPSVMQSLALAFAVLSIIFYVVSMMLGNLRVWARTMFGYLVVPCSLMYPVVWSTATGASNQSPSAVTVIRCAILALLALACFSIIFYRAKAVTERIPFK